MDEVSVIADRSEYNYVNFPLDMDMPSFRAFREDAPSPGEPAPDGEVTNAATGARTNLSDLWSKGHLVIEFGSIT